MKHATRAKYLQDELEGLERNKHEVQIFINEHYSMVGTIQKVDFDYVTCKEQGDKKNPYVIIPISQIKYVRIIQ